MFYLYLIAVTLFLFLAFMALTLMELRTGTRVLAVPRARLDHWVSRASFIVEHVNWSEFLAHMVRSLAARVAHDIVHATLVAVRFVERQLTRVMRYLRDRRPNVLAPQPSRPSIFSQVQSYVQRTVGRRSEEK
ncbi:MAG: hypothetical protein P4M11_00675 [Candidatus Pacebacteria bacterium]|nr:hypothetical protein [Candidatus Paceibacterota bacterium]